MEDEIFKTLRHESNRNNKILKYALYFTEVHLSNSKFQKGGIMQKNLEIWITVRNCLKLQITQLENRNFDK